MELNLAQFLGELKTAKGHFSVAGGVVTLPSGEAFDASKNAKELQTLLAAASHDLKDASSTLAQFTESQEGDKPHYQDTLDQLKLARQGLEAV